MTIEAAGEKVYPAAILALVSGDFSQIEFGGSGRMCAKGTEINVTGAGLGIRPSGAAALFELLAAAAGAWLVPPEPRQRSARRYRRFPARRDFLNSGHRFLQVLLGIGVAETDVAIAVLAEAASVEAGDACLIQQEIRQFPGTDSGGRHVGEGVNRTARQSAAEPRNPVQAGDNDVAAPAELGHHGVDAIARPGERRDAGALREA